MIDFLSTFTSNSLLNSPDDKTKVKIGIPAVSYFVHSRKYFEERKDPHTQDHDFPISNGMLISPSGYLIMRLKEKTFVDKYDRLYFEKPEPDELYVFNRSFYHSATNAFIHANDIFQIISNIKNKPSILGNTVNNGPDFNPASYLVIIAFGHLWRKLGLGQV